MPQNKKLFLLDAMALIYRAYFALNKNPRINSKGMNTSAIVGFANSLYDILKNESPTHIGVAFDTAVPTLRHEEFGEYKATREKMPEDIQIAIPYIKKLIAGFNIPVLLADGYEADDIIGTIARKAENEGFKTYMVTSDKDFGQLVTQNTFIYKPAKGGEKAQVMGIKEVCEKYGIDKPVQLIDILGLWGDASDNIPGVPGVGEKTASKLINEYHDIESLLKNTSDLKGKLRENLEKFAEQARLSRDLATIITDAPVVFNEEELKIGEPDKEALKVLFDELEFRSFAKRVFTDLSVNETRKSPTAPPDLFSDINAAADTELAYENEGFDGNKVDYTLVNTPGERAALIELLSKSGSFCFDTETTGLDTSVSELVGISFCIKPKQAWFVLFPENQGESRKVAATFRELFENYNIAKSGQNLKFDISVLKYYGIEVNGKLFDTMIAHYLLEPDMRHNMDYLAETYLNYKPVPIEDLIGKKGKNQKNMRWVDHKVLSDYACEDADITLQLKQVFEPLIGNAGLSGLFNDVEMPLVKVLASMEMEGVRLDINALNVFSKELEQEAALTEKAIYEMAGLRFNIAIRKAFVPRNEEYILLAADYSQIELRIIAELSNDKSMVEAFSEGLDIHAATASKVYDVPIDMVSKEMRRNAKTVNFGIVYGISPFGLSERLNIPRGEAKEIIDAYFAKYPGVKNYMDESIAFARAHGYVETIMGRRRYLRDINSSNAVVRGFAERNAINAPIQGSSADMIKIAMIRIFEEFSKRKLRSKMILQVHDELVFDAHKDEVEEISSVIIDYMKNAIPLKVPVVVDMNVGDNWLQAH